MIEIVKMVEHNVEISHQPTPDGMVDVATYNPHSTPWDYHGGKFQREMIKVLAGAGIEGAALTTNRRNLVPMGTGPYGRVRFGDDMLPGTFRVAVKSEDRNAALAAIEAHKAAIDRWLNEGGTMPEACRS
jgi:hypothetical protein